MTRCVDPLLLTGTLVVRAGLVAGDRLQASLLNQIGHRAARWPGKRLGHHLVCEGVVERRTLEKLLGERDAAGVLPADVLLGRIAIGNGLISEKRLSECLAHQESERAAGRVPAPLGRIIRERGLMSEHDLQAVIDRQQALVGLSERRAPQNAAETESAA